MYASDSELIDAMLQQNEEAYRFAIKKYQTSMLFLARSIVGRKFDDEVVQEAWVSVLKALPKFEQRSAFKTWILSIVANEAKSRLRKEKRNISLEHLTAEDPEMIDRFDTQGHWSTAPTEWHASSPESLLSSEQLATCLDHSIAELPSMQGATLSLRERQGYSLHEICNILEVSESNVRVLLHRARNRLFVVIEHFQLTGECCTN
ncbi:MAG: RNA polymerase sigma factor [Pseudomonadales bacterium]|nr:RNA polymerase sigma factor [Pseudomonadales bacterium]